MDAREQARLEFYLIRLAANLSTPADALPALDETIASYAQDAGIRARIAALAQGAAVNRFYAAVLLSAVEKDRAEEILAKLHTNETMLTVQKSVGHGAVRVPLGLFARDFTDQRSFYGDHLAKIEALAGWTAAIVAEKSRAGKSFDENALPPYPNILEAEKDAEKMRALRPALEKLKAGSVAERFYAAAVLKEIDQAEAQTILEGLLSEQSEIGVLSGDLMMNFPASEVAAGLLGLNPAKEAAPAGQTPLARLFKWIGG